MKLIDLKKMEFKGTKVLISKVRNGSAVEVELYFNPKDKKSYQVDKEAGEYREVSKKEKDASWKKLEEESLMKNLKEYSSSLLEKTSETIGDVLQSAQETYDRSDVKKKVDKASEQTFKVLEKTGVPKVAKTVYKEADKHIDTFTGVKILELVEERLTIQSRYNDILATKLEEALRRIEEIESRLSHPKA